MTKVNRVLAVFLCLLLCFQQTGFAQVVAQLDIAVHLGSLHARLTIDKFRPVHLRYLQYLPETNNFRLLLDRGSLNPSKKEVEDASKDLLKYFFIGLSLPNDTFWVNLRPDSPNDIIDPLLAQTDVGKILLEADLQLKKDTARFTSPDTAEGKDYWDKLYQKAEELFGSQGITIPTLTRPWIVPEEIIIRETTDSAYIYKATLKVMLEQDYLKNSKAYNFKDERLKDLNEYSSQLIRETVIPKLIKEVNTSKKYASLRQVYYSLILASWFKARNQGKDHPYARIIDRRDLTNLVSKEHWSQDTYFNAYKENFAKGEYNIQQQVYTYYGKTFRSYFSGGIGGLALAILPLGAVQQSDPDGPKILLGPAIAEGIPEAEALNQQIVYSHNQASLTDLDGHIDRPLPIVDNRMKVLGIRDPLDEDGESGLLGRRDSLIERARNVRINDFDGGIRARIVYDDTLGDVAAYHFTPDKNMPREVIIVINSNVSAAIQKEGIYHEAREAYWMLEGFDQHQAHVIASAEQTRGTNTLTAYHESQLQNMGLYELEAIIREDETMRQWHHSVLTDAGIDLGDVNNYERMLRRRAEELASAKDGFGMFNAYKANPGAAVDKLLQNAQGILRRAEGERQLDGALAQFDDFLRKEIAAGRLEQRVFADVMQRLFDFFISNGYYLDFANIDSLRTFILFKIEDQRIVNTHVGFVTAYYVRLITRVYDREFIDVEGYQNIFQDFIVINNTAIQRGYNIDVVPRLEGQGSAALDFSSDTWSRSIPLYELWSYLQGKCLRESGPESWLRYKKESTFLHELQHEITRRIFIHSTGVNLMRSRTSLNSIIDEELAELFALKECADPWLLFAKFLGNAAYEFDGAKKGLYWSILSAMSGYDNEEDILNWFKEIVHRYDIAELRQIATTAYAVAAQQWREHFNITGAETDFSFGANSQAARVAGILQGLFVVQPDATTAIYVNRDEIDDYLDDFALVLGKENPSREEVLRYLDGHETLHALVNKLRNDGNPLSKISLDKEEDLAAIFGRAFALFDGRVNRELIDEIEVVEQALGMILLDTLQNRPQNLESLLNALSVRVELREIATPLEMEKIKAQAERDGRIFKEAQLGKPDALANGSIFQDQGSDSTSREAIKRRFFTDWGGYKTPVYMRLRNFASRIAKRSQNSIYVTIRNLLGKDKFFISGEDKPDNINVGVPHFGLAGQGRTREKYDIYFSDKVDDMENFLAMHPEVELLATPESSFFEQARGNTPYRQQGYRILNDYLEFRKSGRGYEVSDGTQDAVEAFKRIQSMAKRYRTNIVLGTVREKYTKESATVYFNSAVIINNSGEVVHIRRKSGWVEEEGDEGYYGQGTDAEVTKKFSEDYYTTAVPVFLSNREGKPFSIFVTICADAHWKRVWKNIRGVEVDLFIHVAQEGDEFYTEESNFLINDVPSTKGNYLVNKLRDKDQRFPGHLGTIVISADTHLVKINGAILLTDSRSNQQKGLFPQDGNRINIKRLVFGPEGMRGLVSLRERKDAGDDLGAALTPREERKIDEDGNLGQFDSRQSGPSRSSSILPSPGVFGGIDGSARSAGSPSIPGKGELGGIDLRSLPIVTRAIGNLRVNMDAQAINRLRGADVSKELEEIQRMVEAGIVPSAERIKEYVQASSSQGNLDTGKVISFISDILRHEEESCCATDPTLRDILVVLESSRSNQELKTVFLGGK